MAGGENGVFGKFRNFTIAPFSGVAKIESRFTRGVPKVDGCARKIRKVVTEPWRPTRIWHAATDLSYPTYSEQIGRSVLNLHTSHITEEEQPALPLNRRPGPTPEQSSGPVLFTIPRGAVPNKDGSAVLGIRIRRRLAIAGGRSSCRSRGLAAPRLSQRSPPTDMPACSPREYPPECVHRDRESV